MGMLLEEWQEGHQQPGSAEPTLQRVSLVERLLERMQGVALGQIFYGPDLMTVGLHREQEAGADRLAIE
jgi:hypothetical protein